MQDLPQDFRGLMARWPSMRRFAAAIGADPEQGRIFHRRNRVPRKFWPVLQIAADAMGLRGVDRAYLVRLYEAGRGQGR